MDGLPPDYFNHPYNGPVIEQVLPLEEVQKICKGSIYLKACLLFRPNFKGDTCYIVIPTVGKGGVERRYQDILRQ